MSNRYAHVVVLCEDLRHYNFVRRYLILRGVEEDDIVPRISPSGRGAGSRYVLEKAPDEVRAIRRRACRAGLVMVIDSDNFSVEDRLRQLNQSMEQSGVSNRGRAERIAVLSPKRNIETWIFHLCGNAANEEDDYKNRVSPSDLKTSVAAFAKMCPHKCEEIPLPSLQHACKELTAFVDLGK